MFYYGDFVTNHINHTQLSIFQWDKNHYLVIQYNVMSYKYIGIQSCDLLEIVGKVPDFC